MSQVTEHYLDAPEAIASYFAELEDHEHSICAVDTEADSLHSYETKMCLIQFAIPDSLAIIDPLSVEPADLNPMLDYLRTADAVWMHGADYDMAMFRKTFDWIPEVVWDTQTAARLLGVKKYGLANLLEDEFGLVVNKKSQKADWGRRPLQEKLIAYAFNDVRYLIELGNRYLARLGEKGRRDWFEESCAAGRKLAAERVERAEDDLWRVTGWGKLEPKGLAFLRALWKWRDEECRRLDRPHFKFMSNQDLLDLASQLQEGQRIEPPKYLRPAYARRLLKTVTKTRELPESEYPAKFRRTGGSRIEIDEDRYNQLRAHRDQVAANLEIDPPLIATRQILEMLAAPDSGANNGRELLLTWQRDLLAEIL